jgi:hypothetical protein
MDLIQSLDGYQCINCTLNDCENCPIGSYRSDTYPNGSYYEEFISECIYCDSNATSQIGAQCVSLNSLVSLNTQVKDEPTNFNYIFPNDQSESLYFRQNLVSAYRLCVNLNQTACQWLANICVMNLYKESGPLDACSSYKSLKKNESIPLPWIYYDISLNDYFNKYLKLSDPIVLEYVSTKCLAAGLNFYLLAYELEGTLVHFDKLDLAKICSGVDLSQIDLLSTTNLNTKCSLDLNYLVTFKIFE